MTLPQKLEKDTAKVVSEGERLANFVKGADWQFIKRKLLSKILDLQSVRNIAANKSPEQIAVEVFGRNAAVEILLAFLNDVEGGAQQLADNFGVLESYEQEWILEIPPR